jgi:hypothetical protein
VSINDEKERESNNGDLHSGGFLVKVVRKKNKWRGRWISKFMAR